MSPLDEVFEVEIVRTNRIDSPVNNVLTPPDVLCMGVETVWMWEGKGSFLVR